MQSPESRIRNGNFERTVQILNSQMVWPQSSYAQANSELRNVIELHTGVHAWRLSIRCVLSDLSSVFSSRRVVATFSRIATSPSVEDDHFVESSMVFFSPLKSHDSRPGTRPDDTEPNQEEYTDIVDMAPMP